MANQQVSLYIDDSMISVLVSKGREPLKWSTAALEPGLVKEGVVQDQDTVAAKLKEILRSQRIIRRRINFAISGINCLYQLMLLPEMPENLRGEAIKREASHSLGIPLEGVYLSWQVLSVEHGQMKVFLAVVPRDKVDSQVAALRLAGLRPAVMDIKPLALARMSSEPRAIMVDTCQNALDIVVLGEGIPEVVRSLYLDPQTQPGERMAFMRSELERAISFYNAAHMDKPIDLTVPIFVSGDLAGQDSEKASLAGPRERPVLEIVSPFVEKDAFAAAKYVTCIGLAMKEVLVQETGAVAYSLVNFNALPEEYQVRKRPLAEVVWLPVVLVGVVVIGMGVWGILYLKSENSQLTADVNGVNQRAQEQMVRLEDIQALTGQVQAAETPQGELKKQLDALEQGRDVVVDCLELVHESAQATGVDLQNVSLDGIKKAVVAAGTADTEAEMFNFARTLQNSGRFSSVNVTSISAQEVGISFMMELAQA